MGKVGSTVWDVDVYVVFIGGSYNRGGVEGHLGHSKDIYEYFTSGSGSHHVLWKVSKKE
jgi:hypothetical protein